MSRKPDNGRYDPSSWFEFTVTVSTVKEYTFEMASQTLVCL